jgi:sortase A
MPKGGNRLLSKIKILGGAFILVGILVISYALGAKYWTENKQNNMINNYEKRIQNAKHEKKGSKENNEASQVNSIDYGTIGILVIPKIDLKVAIGEGADLKTLKYAVGHFKNTAMPGQVGNFCVAGHRSYTFGEYFNRLGEIKIGDEILVETIKGNYKYKVYNTQVVLPTDTEVLNPTQDATMTLVTCTPIRVGTHRLIIKASEIK